MEKCGIESAAQYLPSVLFTPNQPKKLHYIERVIRCDARSDTPFASNDLNLNINSMTKWKVTVLYQFQNDPLAIFLSLFEDRKICSRHEETIWKTKKRSPNCLSSCSFDWSFVSLCRSHCRPREPQIYTSRSNRGNLHVVLSKYTFSPESYRATGIFKILLWLDVECEDDFKRL